MKISIIYFDFPFWRAEIARLSLFIGNIEFDDVRITSEEFQRVKKNEKFENSSSFSILYNLGSRNIFYS